MSLPGTAGLAPALAAAALAVPAGPAGADIDCRFETECLEGEVCADSGFELTLETALSPGTVLAEGGLPEGDRVLTDTGTAEIDWAAAGPKSIGLPPAPRSPPSGSHNPAFTCCRLTPAGRRATPLTCRGRGFRCSTSEPAGRAERWTF